MISPDTDKNEKKKSISLEIDDSDDDVICLDDPLPDQKVASKKQKAKDEKRWDFPQIYVRNYSLSQFQRDVVVVIILEVVHEVVQLPVMNQTRYITSIVMVELKKKQ